MSGLEVRPTSFPGFPRSFFGLWKQSCVHAQEGLGKWLKLVCYHIKIFALSAIGVYRGLQVGCPQERTNRQWLSQVLN